MLEYMQSYRKLVECRETFSQSEFPSYSPMLVHCSAGIGRTGLLIAIYNIIEALTFSMLPGNYERIKETLGQNKYMQEKYQ